MVGSSINLCCYKPVKVSNVRFSTRMTVPWSISTARNGWGMARYGSCHWCVPITETNCNPIVSGEITTSKKKIYMRARACTHKLKERMGDGNCQTATVASNKWPSSIWHIQRIACCVSIHSAIPHRNVRLYMGWFSSAKKVKWDATYRRFLFLFRIYRNVQST